MSKLVLWSVWGLASTVGTVLLTVFLPSVESTDTVSQVFLPGETTVGHYQIELKCGACHEPGVGSVRENACLDCHAAELKLARDTHPKSKFIDPTKAQLLEAVDATSCITCHKEHVPQHTRAMGVTLPDDYCWHCHQTIAEDRPSHAGMKFNSCATAGCHNFHDNSALYENFLWKHIGQDNVLAEPYVPIRDFEPDEKRKLSADDQDAPSSIEADQKMISAWEISQHALAGVNCSDCHQRNAGDKTTLVDWHNKVEFGICQNCHKDEVEGFLQSRHGMRLGNGLSPMTPEHARLSMHAGAHHQELTCNACHQDHDYNTRTAAVDACLKCHSDSHSTAYQDTAHYELWKAELAGEAEQGTGVSCATCHLPRVKKGSVVKVEHNQNANLRPVEKMVRSVCQNCHGLQFSLDALCDPAMKSKCFDGEPAVHVESLDMVLKWFESKGRKLPQ